MSLATIGYIALYCLLFSITIMFNARIYYLIKIKQDDPLKATRPWYIENQIDKNITDAFIERG